MKTYVEILSAFIPSLVFFMTDAKITWPHLVEGKAYFQSYYLMTHVTSSAAGMDTHADQQRELLFAAGS